MKYHNLAAFEKHLEQASPDHLARVYLIIAPCAYERKNIVASILAAIQKKESRLEFCSEEATPAGSEGLIDRLNSLSLFTKTCAIYLDAIDKLKKALLSPLSHYATKPSPFTYLLLGASSGKMLTEFYSQAKKELIVCDLSLEKPWDRKERLKRTLAHYAAKISKRFEADALEHLLETIGSDLAGLEQEVLKLSTYVGKRSQIQLTDVLALCHQTKKATPWQIAESLVWKETLPASMESVDLSQLLPLIALLRQQLQQGLIIAELLNQGFGTHEISHHVPTLKGATLEKIVPLAAAKRSSYFKRGLNLLFDMEILAKNSAVDPELLLQMFRVKLTASL